jgi:pilus assembly protein CpaE
MKVLVARNKDRGREELVAELERAGHIVEATASEAFASSFAADTLPDVLVCGDMVGKASGRDLVSHLRSMPLTRQMPVLILVDYRSRMDQLKVAVEVGANDAAYRRASALEVAGRVRRLLDSRGADGEAPRREANTVTIVSARGGSGKTVLACNLAVAIARYSGETVALLDLNLEFGTTATMLDLQPHATFSQIARASVQEPSDDAFDALLLHHHSGVRLLPALASPGDSELLKDETVTALIQRLRRTYNHVIIDARPSFREYMIDLWDASNTLVVPCPADVPSVSVTQALLTAFSRVEVPIDKVLVVLNNVIPRGGLSRGQTEKFLERDVYEVPNGGDAMQTSINQGKPYILSHPDDPAGQGIRGLADRLLTRFEASLIK